MKNILFGAAGRRRLVTGARLAARVVGATLGPGGRTVLVERSWAPPYATKDGVTVAREVQLLDRHAHMGAMFTLEASRRTVAQAGDGTTAAAVLVGEMARSCELLRAAGHDPMALACGMRRAGQNVVAAIEALARPVETTADLRRVALLAANGDDFIASAVASALETAGLHGVVSIARSRRSAPVEVEEAVGLVFDRGWSNGSGSMTLLRPDEVAAGGVVSIERPLVLLLDDPMGDARGLVSLLEAALRTCKVGTWGGLLIVGRVFGDARATLVRNRQAGQLNAVAVDPPWSSGGMGGSTNGTSTTTALEDIAVATGATVLGARLGRCALHAMSDAAVEVALGALGYAARCEVRATRTLIEPLPVGPRGEPLEERVLRRIEEIGAARERALGAGQEHTADLLSARMARLGGGTVTLRVGGVTETEASERAFRVEDALSATRSAIRSGVVPGGGAALVRASEAVLRKTSSGLDIADEVAGWGIVLRACSAPFRLLCSNAGEDGLHLVRLLQEEPSGTTWDLRERRFADAWSAGILDPCDVVVCALRNAVSAAASLVEVEASVHPLRDRDDDVTDL